MDLEFPQVSLHIPQPGIFLCLTNGARTPGETRESSLEFKDAELERISLEVHVTLKNQQIRRTAETRQMACSVVAASFE